MQAALYSQPNGVCRASQNTGGGGLPAANLVLYLNEASGIVGSNPVLIDQSVAGNDATQADTAKQFTGRVESLNGLDLLVFDADGVDDVMITPPVNVTSGEMTLFFVISEVDPTVSGYHKIFTKGDSDRPDKGVIFARTGSTAFDWMAGDFDTFDGYAPISGNSRAIGPVQQGANNWIIVQIVLSATQSRMWVNGVQASTRVEVAARVIDDNNPITLAANFLGIDQFWQGSYAALAIYSDVNEARNAAAYAFLAAKYAAWLPSSAAYYLRPDGTSRYLRPDGTSFYLRP